MITRMQCRRPLFLPTMLHNCLLVAKHLAHLIAIVAHSDQRLAIIIGVTQFAVSLVLLPFMYVTATKYERLGKLRRVDKDHFVKKKSKNADGEDDGPVYKPRPLAIMPPPPTYTTVTASQAIGQEQVYYGMQSQQIVSGHHGMATRGTVQPQYIQVIPINMYGMNAPMAGMNGSQFYRPMIIPMMQSL